MKDKRLNPETALTILILIILLVIILQEAAPFFKIPNSCRENLFDEGTNWPNCMIDVAKDTGDKGVCEYAGNLVGDCIDAATLYSTKKCERLGSDERDRCISGVADFSHDPSLCNEIESIRIREKCYLSAGGYYLDTCLALNSTEVRDHCLFLFGVRKGNVTLCSEIVDPQYKSRCLEENGVNDYLLCLEIENEDHRDDCLERVGKNSNNVTICKMAENRFNRERCLREVAISLSDPSICNEIETDYVRENCISQFED